MAEGREPASKPLAAGREALARGEWERADELLRAALEQGDDAEAWEGIGWAAWWQADEAATFEARERAFRLYRETGEDAAAGRVATWLAADFREYRGEDGIGRGWLERAHRLLDPLAQTADYGWLALIDADFALNVEGDLDAVARLAQEAAEIGRDQAVPDLEAVGLSLEGQALVSQGKVDDGMRLLEEAAAIAGAEELRMPISAGWSLCCVLSACDGVGDFGRAEQWCEAIQRFTERWGGRQLVGVCRTSYGRILATRGEWSQAESELTAAIRDIDAARPGMAGTGLARLGELRARQGRPEEARELFERAGPAGLVGLGELALEEGDAAGAIDNAERVLRRLPEGTVIDRLPPLELAARGRIALGELDAAAGEVEAVERTATALGTAYVRGRADLLRAELAAARGEHDDARRACEDAIDCFAEASAVYEAARARARLARALTALGRAEQAGREAGSARATLEHLGARVEVARLEAGEPGDDDSELTPRELEVLRLVAQGRSDAEIAADLVLSPHTVHRHVANVRLKLRLPSRSAAVAYAAREGLL
jgi:ATP/maltotriose-dependent transcriptional regulator MalT